MKTWPLIDNDYNKKVSNPMTPSQRTLRGPVLMRHEDHKTSTYDQRLLQSGSDHEWQHADPWRVLRIQSEFVTGFDTLAKIPKAVSVFGSARTKPEEKYYQLGEEVGRKLVEADYAVITGGGPGIMEAGNKGAHEAGGLSIGLGIELPFEQGLNEYVDLGIDFRYFFARKTMFLKYSQAFICLPGGLGTMDEFFEVMCMVQTGKVTKFPIVCMGTEYWAGLLEWMRTRMVDDGYINAEDNDLLLLTDDVDEAIAHIQAVHKDMSDARLASLERKNQA